MNWEAISAIGEIVGALAVVITLVYLAIQIREQNRESRAAAIDSLSQQWRGLMSDLSTSETLSDIYLRGLADFDGLSPSEKMRFTTILSQTAQITESLHKHHRLGRLDPGMWEGYETRMRDVFSNPGVKTWWGLRRHWFSPQIREYIDEIVETTKTATGYESFESTT